jgi:hypothetical protein
MPARHIEQGRRSPTNEAAVFGLTGQIVNPLRKAAGVRVLEGDDGSYRVEQLP